MGECNHVIGCLDDMMDEPPLVELSSGKWILETLYKGRRYDEKFNFCPRCGEKLNHPYKWVP